MLTVLESGEKRTKRRRRRVPQQYQTAKVQKCQNTKVEKRKNTKVCKNTKAEKRRRLVEAVEEEDVERSTTVASWYSYYSAGSTSEGNGVVGLDNGVTL